MRRVGVVVFGGLAAAAAFLVLQDPASAQPDDRGPRPERDTTELAARKAERQEELQARMAERRAEVTDRLTERKAGITAHKAERQAEMVADTPAPRSEPPPRTPARSSDSVPVQKATETTEPKQCTCDPVTNPGVFTLDADFDKGDANNVVHTPSDQLQLAEEAGIFPYLWVAVSSRGTIAKINTDTGQVVGEYASAPAGQPKDPSRTTVDQWGNVWATNRAGNSVVRIGLLENNQCRGPNTSTGLGDVRPWTGTTVAGAQDDCILAYVPVTSNGTRHISVSVTEEMGVWVSGTKNAGRVSPGNQNFDLIDPMTGTIVRHEPSVGFGGYGGVTDRNGVIWSARPLLRWDTKYSLDPNAANGATLVPLEPVVGQTPTSPVTGYVLNTSGFDLDTYGLCIDSQGNVWNTTLQSNTIRKYASDGTLLASFYHGNHHAQGCVVGLNDDVWVAHSVLPNTNSPLPPAQPPIPLIPIRGQTTVGHLLNDGTWVGNVTVGRGPTGVAVDRKGMIWSTNYFDGTVSRINPGGGGAGAVDLTVDLKGLLYNYSDMTGSAIPGVAKSGSWEVVYDCGGEGAEWGTIDTTSIVPLGSDLIITASSSADGVTFSDPVEVTPGADVNVPDGRYLKVRVVFLRAMTGESPILEDLTITGIDPNITDCCPRKAQPPVAPVIEAPKHMLKAPHSVGPVPAAQRAIAAPHTHGRPGLAHTGGDLGFISLAAGLALVFGLLLVEGAGRRRSA